MFEERPILHQAPEFYFVLQSYGVRVRIEASSQQLLEEAEKVARRALLDRVEILDNREAEHTFGISVKDGHVWYLTKDGETVTYDSLEPRFYRFFDSLLRITVAEHAEDRVFVHAGVVGWRGRAIVIPANSFRGKSTLVSELVKNGAEYYSDEYAIFDPDGLIHSFPRDLALRYDDAGIKEKLVSPLEMGGKIGTSPIPVGLVLLTEYVENSVWEPERLSVGHGLMEMIPHAIPRIFNPEFTLKVLNTAISDAIILKSHRGEASLFAVELLSFFDRTLNLAKIT